MAFSPWTLLGQSLGGGFNQGFQNQLGFQNTLKKADQLSQLPQDQQSLALALMGSGKSGGNPLDQVIAALVAQQFGLGQTGMPAPTVPQSTATTPSNSMIRVREKSSGQEGSIPQNEFDPKLYDRI